MNILLLSLGGGGGSILRSAKELFLRDLAVTQKTDARFAQRLGRAVTTRFLDTNEFSLAGVPQEERVLIGERTTGHLGARHDPAVAAQALEESKADVDELISGFSVVIVIGTGGKGTGAGTMFPVAQMARAQRKLVIPIFVRPSFERHEVDKRRYDHALGVVDRFDSARIRLIEILNDRGYADDNPQPQAAVWERMNRPIARGLRGLMYVLSDLSQVDPSDLSMLFSGNGRLRMGFAEIDPLKAQDPSDEQVAEAVRTCWENPYYSFSKPVGTSLVCIQGHWSNVVDAGIKGGLAALANAGAPAGPYTPLYARAAHVPKPWGVTALFAEDTGVHAPLDIDWGSEKEAGLLIDVATRPRDVKPGAKDEPAPAPTSPRLRPPTPSRPDAPMPSRPDAPSTERTFGTFWDLAVAVNRAESAALAIARNGDGTEVPVDEGEVRKLLGTIWFRGVVPELSELWRQRVLEVLVTSTTVTDHRLKVEHRSVRLSEMSYAQLSDVVKRTSVPDSARADVTFLISVGRLWGPDAITRFTFVDAHNGARPGIVGLIQGLRH